MWKKLQKKKPLSFKIFAYTSDVAPICTQASFDKAIEVGSLFFLARLYLFLWFNKMGPQDAILLLSFYCQKSVVSSGQVVICQKFVDKKQGGSFLVEANLDKRHRMKCFFQTPF